MGHRSAMLLFGALVFFTLTAAEAGWIDGRQCLCITGHQAGTTTCQESAKRCARYCDIGLTIPPDTHSNNVFDPKKKCSIFDAEVTSYTKCTASKEQLDEVLKLNPKKLVSGTPKDLYNGEFYRIVIDKVPEMRILTTYCEARNVDGPWTGCRYTENISDEETCRSIGWAAFNHWEDYDSTLSVRFRTWADNGRYARVTVYYLLPYPYGKEGKIPPKVPVPPERN